MERLSASEIAALHEALDDEYRAWSTYDQVIADFGEVRPFVNIRDAEARHIAALTSLFERHGLPVPANPWPGRVERYPSVQAACEGGVEAEIANGALYERLLTVARQPNVVTVLRRLQQASQQRHLPAFRRCAEGESHRAGGTGHRRHRGGRA